MILEQATFHERAAVFIGNLHGEVRNRINVDGCEIDHVCYRVDSEPNYQSAKAKLTDMGKLLTEVEVHGRPISTFKLHTPIEVTDVGPIDVVELPSPKPGVPYDEGFEHIEYVLPTTFDSFVSTNSILKSEGRLSWRDYNPELQIKVGNHSAKFHYDSLEDVIALENMPLEKRRITVLDFDGTIVDSTTAIEKINRRILRQLGASPSTIDGIEAFASTYDQVVEQARLPTKMVSDFVFLWSEAIQKTNLHPFQEALDLIEQLNSQSAPIILWTARDKTSTLRWLRQHNLQTKFKRIWTYDSKPTKPDLGAFRFLTGARPPELINYYGDSATDQLIAQKVGATFHWATWNPLVRSFV